MGVREKKGRSLRGSGCREEEPQKMSRKQPVMGREAGRDVGAGEAQGRKAVSGLPSCRTKAAGCDPLCHPDDMGQRGCSFPQGLEQGQKGSQRQAGGGELPAARGEERGRLF